MAFEIRAICDGDGCRSISLGDAAFAGLKTFLSKDARRFHRENIAKTFVLAEVGQHRVWAYITLVCTQLEVERVAEPHPVENFRFSHYPAVKLARLAVDASLQGQNVGSQLVDFALGVIVNSIMPHAGCRFLLLDAKPTSVNFYRKKGFTVLGAIGDGDAQLTMMFVDLHRLNRAEQTP